MGIAQFLRNLDIFGQPIRFNLKGQSRSNSLTGVCLSIVLVILIISASYYFLLEFLDDTNPVMRLKSGRRNIYPNMKLNRDGQLYVWAFFINFNDFIPRLMSPLFFDIKFEYETVEMYDDPLTGLKKQKINKTEIPIISCNDTKWYPGVEGEFFKPQDEKLLMQHFTFCINHTALDPVIYGGVETGNYSKFSINLYPCKFGPMCKTFSEMRFVQIWIGLIQHGMDPSNYKKPFQYYRDFNARFRFHEGVSKHHRLFVDQMISQTDEGLFQNTYREDRGYKVDYYLEDTQNYYPGEPFFKLDVMGGNRYLEYTRAYTKVLDLISSIGGIGKILAYFLMILYIYYIEYVQKKELLRYGILNKNMMKKKTNSKKNSVHQHNTGNNKGAIEMVDQDKNLNKQNSEGFQIKINEEPQEKFFKGKESFFDKVDKHSYNDMYKYFLYNSGLKCCGTELTQARATHIKNCEELLEKRTDIYTLLNELNDLIVLKDAFFTEEHKTLSTIVGINTMQEEKENQAKLESISVDKALENLRKSLATEEDPVKLRLGEEMVFVMDYYKEFVEGKIPAMTIKSFESLKKSAKSRSSIAGSINNLESGPKTGGMRKGSSYGIKGRRGSNKKGEKKLVRKIDSEIEKIEEDVNGEMKDSGVANQDMRKRDFASNKKSSKLFKT